MKLQDWKSAAGIYHDAFIDSEWIDSKLYVSRTNGELLEELIGSSQNRESQIMLVTGPYGIGKGAFKHALESKLNQDTDVLIKTFTVKQPNFTELQFYRAFGNAIGVDFVNYLHDRWEVRRKLEKKIVEETQDKFILLIVDDAHYITSQALHAIKYITDIEQNNKKCCTALLLGTEKILETLNRGSLGQVADRIHLRRKLKAFSQRDTLEYIARAMTFATEKNLPKNYEFPDTPEEVQKEAKRLQPFQVMAGIRVHALTSGVPRHVRLLCSEAIKVAAANCKEDSEESKFNITSTTIEEAWDSLLARKEIHAQ